MGAVAELEQGARAVAERAGPAVVAIGRGPRGSGVVIEAGQVLTNAHNLRDRTTSVTFADGRVLQASVIGLDPDGDLAVLAVETDDAAPVAWGDPGEVTAGALVYAVARGRNGLRTTFGLVTGTEQEFRGPRGRRIRGSIEHSAPLARGSSGGPVLDGEGRLLALNTRRLGEGFY
nr:trypsin-like peptidase domain-containing protein [Acidimicrobiia bacterium]